MKRIFFLNLFIVLALFIASPLYAFDILEQLNIDPDRLEKAKKIFEGATNIMASSTDLDYSSEFAIGESLALEGFKRYGLPIRNQEFQRYVNLLGNSIARNSTRSDISYYFVVVDSSIYNAFSCPGGIIFISSALIKSMNDESELASVLAHEIAHISHKHALKSIKRAKFFEGVSKITAVTMKKDDGKSFQEMIGNLQTTLFDNGLDQNMEFEADASAMDLLYRTGYAPSGFIKVLEMLQAREAGSEKKGSWFSTHPPLYIRISKCQGKMSIFGNDNKLAKGSERFIEFKKKGNLM
ncbi:MAG: M48 family metallopeptidase [Desulfobacterales bacterium]|nr:M48 family metallopeptidase [Desulfobacterales bacterium]MBF0397471.1 M48 family metallopeptidase [Desulfobacterales bacterium]